MLLSLLLDATVLLETLTYAQIVMPVRNKGAQLNDLRNVRRDHRRDARLALDVHGNSFVALRAMGWRQEAEPLLPGTAVDPSGHCIEERL